MDNTLSRRWKRACRAWLTAVLLAISGFQAVSSGDAFVLISGGNSPMDNNHSQYLQARAIAHWLEENCPPDSVWTFFGAGNVTGEPPLFSDVYRQRDDAGVRIDTWFPGALPKNRPAKREFILNAIKNEILPSIAGGGTLFLFVGDHGSRASGDDGESVINLWTLARDEASERGWQVDPEEVLSVTDLRDALRTGLGKGRVVFCMTQCHSGGFHFISVPREIRPNRAWFKEAPEWAAASPEPWNYIAAAGFTATDEASPAAGCDPAPDAETWAGYERFFPEQLFGLDMFTLAKKSPGVNSFADAHMAATLVDHTIDKPYSTSEQFLDRWAALIEDRLTDEPSIADSIRTAVEEYHQAVDGKDREISDPAFAAARARFERMTAALAEQLHSARETLRSGGRSDIEALLASPRRSFQSEPGERRPRRTQRPRQRRNRDEIRELRRQWTQTVRPAWIEWIERGPERDPLGAATGFEKHLIRLEQEGADFFFPRGAAAMQSEVFWESGYSKPSELDPAKAAAIARWGAERSARILAWAQEHPEESVVAAGMKLAQWREQRRTMSPPDSTPDLTEETAAARVLFYRRALAAWAFLIATGEEPALEQLRRFVDLENLPVPRPGSEMPGLPDL